MTDSVLRTEVYSLTTTTGQPLTITAAQRLDAQTVRLDLAAPLVELTEYRLTLGSGVLDLAGNPLEGAAEMLLSVPESFVLTEVSPTDGEGTVSLTREVVIRFSEPVDPATVTAESFFVQSLDRRPTGNIVVSSNRLFATFFPDNPWRPAAGLQIIVDGDRIRAADGDLLDADYDGTPGGRYEADYFTQSADRIAGTNVVGFVFDAYNRNPDGSNRPIVGATIRLTGIPGITAVTDETGRFVLRDLPAGGVFLDVDGTTATNAPTGMTYVNRPFSIDTVAGVEIPLTQRGVQFDCFLPTLSQGDVVRLSPADTTMVGFGAATLAEAQRFLPGVTEEQLRLIQVGFPANSATNEQQVPAASAVVLAVPPDRLPSPLPPELNPTLVISVQPVGATNFDEPATMTFPNFENLAPGEKSLIWEFDRDQGCRSAWPP